MLHQLRRRRYLMLGALMIVVAAVCALAGTWQVERFLDKRAENHLLRANAGRAPQAVGDVLSRVGGPGADRRARDARFRPVTASGTYDAAAQLTVRERTVDGVVGFLVLTPLRPAAGGPVLLVVRGFVAADNGHPPSFGGPPTTPVQLVGRVQPPEHDDGFGREPAGQVKAVDPAAAGARLRAPAWNGYVELLPGQPGTEGVTPMPAPDLSNPAGGAVEPQHFAYIIQWYLFALLALAAPLVMARTDSRYDVADAADDFDGAEFTAADFAAADFAAAGPHGTIVDAPASAGLDPDRAGLGAGDDPAEAARRAKLADRYGSVRRI